MKRQLESMHKTFIWTVLTLLLLAACAEHQGAADLPPAQAQSTAASEADAGDAPAVAFQRAAEGPASLQEWRIYTDGRVAMIAPSPEGDVTVRETQVDEGAVTTLLQDLETAGFYEAAQAGQRRWNEDLTYVISTHVDGEWHALTIEGITPQTSPVRLQSLGVVEQFIFEEIEDRS